jgi:mannose-1-phosphate guanylyltransferase
MYAVILAGGGGTRLWPLSRPERPKPFLPLLGGESLLRRTAARVRVLVGWEGVYVIADRAHLGIVREQVPEVPAENILVEPVGRNTAAAVAYATAAIERPADEVMAVLPADHHIGNEELFRGVLEAASRIAAGTDDGTESAPLVTLGIQPT